MSDLLHGSNSRWPRWRIVLAVGGLVVSGCGRDGAASSVSAANVPNVCSPLGVGGGVAWATSCDGEKVINTGTGEELELHCDLPNDQLEVQDIFPVGSNAAVVFSCMGPSDRTTTMIQSLVAGDALPPTDMNFPAFDIKAAVYSDAGDGYVLMVSGKCDGLLAYQFDAPGSLGGKMLPVSMISLGDHDFELDGGRGYGSAPACTELSAVRAIGASNDGSLLALGLVGPGQESIFEREVEIFAGAITVVSDGTAIKVEAAMGSVASGLHHLAYPLAVLACDNEPVIVINDGGELSIVSDRGSRRLVLDVERPWAGFALDDAGKVLLVESEVDFNAGDVYRADDVEVCDREA